MLLLGDGAFGFSGMEYDALVEALGGHGELA